MSEDSIIRSRTFWAALLTTAASLSPVYQTLPVTMQYGIFAVACSYILARGFQRGCEHKQ